MFEAGRVVRHRVRRRPGAGTDSPLVALASRGPARVRLAIVDAAGDLDFAIACRVAAGPDVIAMARSGSARRRSGDCRRGESKRHGDKEKFQHLGIPFFVLRTALRKGADHAPGAMFRLRSKRQLVLKLCFLNR